MTCFMARPTGPEGKVLGADNSVEQLNVARREASRHELANARFVEANVYSLGLARESFDMVYARSLISHLQHLSTPRCQAMRDRHR